MAYVPTSPTRPHKPVHHNDTPGANSPDSSTDSTTSSTDSYTAAQQQANRNAARMYREQSQHLQAQAAALQHALKRDFKHNLLQNLSDVTDVLKAQQQLVREGYNKRYGQLAGAASDNEMAHADQTTANALNAGRERTAAVAQAMSQGAGESDTLASMMMSLRNWNANQSEVERTNADTLRSINSSLTDLNVDTKTALANNEIQANADREQLWTNYFNQMSTTYTNLGNLRVSQADLGSQARAMSNDAGGGGGGKKHHKAGGSAGGGDRNRPLGTAERSAPRLQEPSSVGRPVLGATSLMRGGVIPTAPKPPATTGGSTPGTHSSDGGGPRTSGGGSGSDSGSGGSGRGGGNSHAFHQAANAFMQASKMAGKSWNNPGVSDKVMNWDGRRTFENHSNMGRLMTVGDLDLGKPEGATLRKWDA